MTFHVGQKVVCVDNGGLGAWWADEPIIGEVYTVAGYGFSERDKEYGLLLEEIHNHPAHGGTYDAARFRPIVERKTDISIFTAMLNPSKQGVDA